MLRLTAFQPHIQLKLKNKNLITDKNICMKNAWDFCSDNQIKQIGLFSNEYKSFLSQCKTERECIKYFCALLEESGFVKLNSLIQSKTPLKAGDKVYTVNMNKALVAFVVGQQDLQNGLNILCAHIDSPRLDLKSNPVYEEDGFCMFDTHYYGGIKHYHWVALPLALHGLVCKKDGSKIDICIGEKDGDPVFGVTDLLPHLTEKQKGFNKLLSKQEEIEGEVLNLIVGSRFKEGSAKSKILDILQEKDIQEKDFYSAEIEVVPAGKARDFGLDESMIIGYGHDDRSCAYCCIRALIDSKNLQKTAAVVLVDKEETGSPGATGMKSKFFENMVAEVMSLRGEYKELCFKRALNKSQVISCDVTAAFDPNWKQPYNKNTEAFLNGGVAFSKYTGSKGKSDSNDANPEFIARLRNILDENKIVYQFTEMGRVDQGGGGTIASILAEYGMEVIDAGLPVLSMHAPWEVISKLDLFENYRFYKAFVETANF